MKLLEDSFSYANQLGARQGAGAVYLHAHHPDIYRFLDTKRENADEKIRIKTLSLGVVIPDITFELAKKDEDMYLFSPYDVEKASTACRSPTSRSPRSTTRWSTIRRIKKTKIKAREFFQTLAEIQFESGYPYIMFEDTVNRANPIDGKITMSQPVLGDPPGLRAVDVQRGPLLRPIGKDISCNLGSLNIAKTMDSPDFGKTIETAIRALTAVSDMTDINSVPSIEQGNDQQPRHRPRPDEPARLPGPRAHPLRLRRGPGLHQHLLLHGGVPRDPRLQPAGHRDAARSSAASRSPSTRPASTSTSTPSRNGSRRPNGRGAVPETSTSPRRMTGAS